MWAANQDDTLSVELILKQDANHELVSRLYRLGTS